MVRQTTIPPGMCSTPPLAGHHNSAALRRAPASQAGGVPIWRTNGLATILHNTITHPHSIACWRAPCVHDPCLAVLGHCANGQPTFKEQKTLLHGQNLEGLIQRLVPHHVKILTNCQPTLAGNARNLRKRNLQSRTFRAANLS